MQLGVTCVYLILAGMNLADLFGWTTRAWISICALLVLIPFLAFRTLKEVALLSAFG